MLINMARQHKERILRLRSGDHSDIPPTVREIGPTETIASVFWFVGSVWLYSKTGYYIFCGFFILCCLVIAYFVVALGRFGPVHRPRNETNRGFGLFEPTDHELLLPGPMGADMVYDLIHVLVQVYTKSFAVYFGTYVVVWCTFLTKPQGTLRSLFCGCGLFKGKHQVASKTTRAVTKNHAAFFFLDFIYITLSVPVVILTCVYTAAFDADTTVGEGGYHRNVALEVPCALCGPLLGGGGGRAPSQSHMVSGRQCVCRR
jgi:hypothetical protein